MHLTTYPPLGCRAIREGEDYLEYTFILVPAWSSFPPSGDRDYVQEFGEKE